MKRQDEVQLYKEQLIGAYLWYGRLCPALKECQMVLPSDSRIGLAVKDALQILTTGEGAEETDPVRRALAGIEEGEPMLILLHDVLAHFETTGEVREDVLKYLLGLQPVERRPDRKRRKKRRRETEIWERSYERLATLPEGRKKKNLRQKLIREIREELPLWITAMVAYSRVFGPEEALRRSQSLVHGALRGQVRRLRGRITEGEEAATAGPAFLEALDLPEVRVCMLTCFGRQGEGAFFYPVSDSEVSQTVGHHLWKKGAYAAILVALVGVMILKGSGGSGDDPKEKRLRHALSQALVEAVGEIPGVRSTNQLLAGFMQHMLREVDDDVDLTVRICEMDRQKQTMEVEAVGEYDSLPGGRQRISVRRRLSF